MLKARWALALLMPVLLVLAACGGDDPTPTPRPTATAVPAGEPTPDADAMFQAEWDALIAAAQEEGELVVILGGAASRAYRPVIEHFGDLFDIKVTAATGRDGEHVSRILAEREAGQFLVDATHLGPTTTRTRAIPAGLIDEIASVFMHPEVLDKSLWFQGRHWYADETEKFLFTQSAGVDFSPVSAYYNTDLVSEADIAAIESVFDLLNPKWKGQIVSLPVSDAGAGGTWYSIYVHPDVGPDWPDRFMREMDVQYTPEARLVADGLAQGKYAWAMAVGAAGRDINGLAAEGLPVAQFRNAVAEAPTLSGSGSSNNTAIFTQPAHPNATKLYINWFLSKEGQTAVHELSAVTPDPTLRIDDVPVGQTLAEERREEGKTYYFLSADPFYLADHEEAIAFTRGVYAEVTGG